MARVVTETLNLTAKNVSLTKLKSFGFYHMFHKLLTINVKLQTNIDYKAIVEPLLQCGNCHLKFEILYSCMVVETIKVLVTFIHFAPIFQHDKAHNMMALMFDPRFKGLTCVCGFVGQEKTMDIIHEYD